MTRWNARRRKIQLSSTAATVFAHSRSMERSSPRSSRNAWNATAANQELQRVSSDSVPVGRAFLSPRERRFWNAQPERSCCAPSRERFTLTPQPRPGVDGYPALRRLLKIAQRVCGLRCVKVEAR
jgi:hypothetical protein